MQSKDVAPAIGEPFRLVKVFEQKCYCDHDAYNDERYDGAEDKDFKIIFYLFCMPLGLSTEGIKGAGGHFAGEFLEKYPCAKDQRYRQKELYPAQGGRYDGAKEKHT